MQRRYVRHAWNAAHWHVNTSGQQIPGERHHRLVVDFDAVPGQRRVAKFDNDTPAPRNAREQIETDRVSANLQIFYPQRVDAATPGVGGVVTHVNVGLAGALADQLE